MPIVCLRQGGYLGNRCVPRGTIEPVMLDRWAMFHVKHDFAHRHILGNLYGFNDTDRNALHHSAG